MRAIAIFFEGKLGIEQFLASKAAPDGAILIVLSCIFEFMLEITKLSFLLVNEAGGGFGFDESFYFFCKRDNSFFDTYN